MKGEVFIVAHGRNFYEKLQNWADVKQSEESFRKKLSSNS